MPTYRWCTQTQFRQRLRDLYLVAVGSEACRLAKLINNQAMTNAQKQALFGVSAAQISAFNSKLNGQAGKYDSMKVEAGQ